MRNLPSRLLWFPLIFFLFFCIYQATRSPVHDFANYYFGSYFVVKGEFDKSLYEPLVFNQKIISAGVKDIWASYSPNPPFTTLLFLPFVYLDIEDAKLMFNILSVALFLSSLIRLAQSQQIPVHHIALIPFTFFFALYNNISFGQVYFLLFFLLVEGYLAMKEEKWLLCAFFWAVAIIFKITPGVLFFFLLFKKKYKALIMLSSACIVLFAISLIINGTDVWRFYISTILPKANQGEVTAAAFSINYQSAHMFFKFLFIPDALDNPNPFFASFTMFTLGILIFKIAIIVLAALYTVKGKSLFATWAIWIVVSFLISPYGSTYAYILFLIPLLIFYEKNKTSFVIYALIIFAVVNFPLKYLYAMPLFFQFPRLYLLLIIFVTLILWARPRWNWKTSVLLAGLFIALETFNFPRQADNSTYLFDRDAHQLIYDYTIEDGYFCYSYWSDSGGQRHKTHLRASALDFDALDIVDNQIFYGSRQITASPDKKLKASILNNNTIVYLSDKGRGYGFYVFRKLSLDSTSGVNPEKKVKTLR
jgi:hypothetical protein